MSFSYYDQSYQKRNNSTSIPLTAQKSPSRLYRQRDEQYGSTPSKFNKRPNQKLQSFKKNIDQCIKSMSNKKQMNRQALIEVRDFNREVADSLCRSHEPSRKQSNQYETYQPNYVNNHPQTSYQPRYDNRERDNISPSGFDLGNNSETFQYSNFQRSQVYRPETPPVNYRQNYKSKLEEEKRRNEQLSQNIDRLRNQNKYIRSTGTFTNTPLRSTHTANDVGSQSLLRQNAQLRSQLQRLENDSQYSLKQIQEQFKLLKEQNDRLRKDTLQILKK